MDNDKTYLTVKEIEAYLQDRYKISISKRTIYNWISRGILEGVRKSKGILVSRETFEKFIENGKREIPVFLHFALMSIEGKAKERNTKRKV